MLFLRASIHQLVDKMNYIEFTVLKAFTSEFKLQGLTPCQSLQWNVYTRGSRH